MSLAPLPPIPIRLELVPALLARRGGRAVSLERLREAANAGWIPATRRAAEAGRPFGSWCIDETGLDAVEAYFREQDAAPSLSAHRRAALEAARGAARARP